MPPGTGEMSQVLEDEGPIPNTYVGLTHSSSGNQARIRCTPYIEAKHLCRESKFFLNLKKKKTLSSLFAEWIG